MYKEKFSLNQVMLERYYEIHHDYSETPPPIELHQHSFYEIFFFLSGNVNYFIEEKYYKLRPGDILLINYADLHRPEIEPGKSYERIVIWLSTQFFEYLQDSYNEDFKACFLDAALNDRRLIRPDEQSMIKFKQLCSQISHTKINKEMGSFALASAYLIELLVYINRIYYDRLTLLNNDLTENEKINQIITYINANLVKELSLDNLADKFYISKYHLSRQFKQFTGLSVYQYIMKKRLIAARNMLKAGCSVMDSCLWCGFNDYSNFLKAFKREFGKTPSQYFKM